MAKNADVMRIKKKRKNNPLDERALVNALIAQLQKTAIHPPYFFIDRDSPDRVFSSGFDFLGVYGGEVIFVEAKYGDGKLTDYQFITKAGVQNAGGRHRIVRFRDVKSLTDFVVEYDGTQRNIKRETARGFFLD